VFVVIIHNGINAETFANRGIDAIIPEYVINIQNFISIITAIAVPLFFLISSYLLYCKADKYEIAMKKRVRSIAVPYILWLIVLIGVYLLVSNISFTKGFFVASMNPIYWSPLKWIEAFLGYFNWDGTSLIRAPYYVPFWFIRDLFILDLLSPIIKRVIEKLPFAAIILCFALWINNIQLYLVSPEALLFFVLGYYVAKYDFNEKQLDAIRMTDISLIYVIMIIGEYLLIDSMPVLRKVNIVIGCLFFLKLAGIMIQNAKLYKGLVWLEKHEFVVYAIHGIIINQLIKIYAKIVPLNGIFMLFGYFFTIIFGIGLSLLFSVVFKKVLPKLYAVMVGGRVA
jgi:surface polysaccharide O-acyltransferase-like enzyme